MEILVIISFVVKIVTMIIIIYSFYALEEPKTTKKMGVLSRYYLLKSRYRRLRGTLLFVAAFVALQVLSMLSKAFFGLAFDEAEILFTDIIFLGLIILLASIRKSWKSLDLKV